MMQSDCPFKKFDALYEIAKQETDYIFVDFHAETTSEKGHSVIMRMVVQVLLLERIHIFRQVIAEFYRMGLHLLQM